MSSSQHPKPTLNELLEIKGASKDEFSKAINVAPNTSRRWGLREVAPSIDKAIAASEFLGCSLKTFCRSIGRNVDGVPDDTPETHELEAQKEQEHRQQMEELALLEELLADTTAAISQLQQYKLRIKKKLSKR